jgi:hypothetical protein
MLSVQLCSLNVDKIIIMYEVTDCAATDTFSTVAFWHRRKGDPSPSCRPYRKLGLISAIWINCSHGRIRSSKSGGAPLL